MDLNTLDEPSPLMEFWSPSLGRSNLTIAYLATQALHAKGHREHEEQFDDKILAANLAASQSSNPPQQSSAAPEAASISQDSPRQGSAERQISKNEDAPVFRSQSPLNGNAPSAPEEAPIDETGAGSAESENPVGSNAPTSSEIGADMEHTQSHTLRLTPPISELYPVDELQRSAAAADQSERTDPEVRVTTSVMTSSIIRIPSISSPTREPGPETTVHEEPMSDLPVDEQAIEETPSESHDSKPSAKNRRRTAFELLEVESGEFLRVGGSDLRERRASAPGTVVLQKKASVGKGSLVAMQTPGRRGRPPKTQTPSVLSASVTKKHRVQKTPAQATPMRARSRLVERVLNTTKSSRPEKLQHEEASGATSTPASNKRGRPRKSEVVTLTPASGRRGRPPKVVVAESTPTSVRRGRPPKTDSAAPTPASVKPGRQPDGEAVDSTDTPNRRGRPPKSVSAPSPTKSATPALLNNTPGRSGEPATPSSAATSIRRSRLVPVKTSTPKTRGRPAKQAAAPAPKPAPTEIKRRGRPPRNTTTADVGQPPEPASSEPTQKRVRFTKEKPVEKETSSVRSMRERQTRPTGANKVASRPTKHETGSTTTKRRGRPPKSVVIGKTPSEHTKNEAVSTDSKKRGRPTKSTTIDKITSQPTENGADSAPAKKRGRMPKSSAVTTVAEAPKKRGRPSRAEMETAEEPTVKRRRTSGDSAGDNTTNGTENVTEKPSGRRGRSQKSDTFEPTATNNSERQSAGKESGGQGRKPAAEQESSSSSIAQPAPRPRGRPAKLNGAGEVEKLKAVAETKTRGRPGRNVTAKGALAKAAHPNGVVKAKSPAKKGQGAVAKEAVTQSRRSLRSRA